MASTAIIVVNERLTVLVELYTVMCWTNIAFFMLLCPDGDIEDINHPNLTRPHDLQPGKQIGILVLGRI